MKKRIKYQGMLTILSVILVIFSPRLIFPDWSHELYDEIIDSIGIFVIGFGLFFRICSRGYKQEFSANSTKLVTNGTYALVRNPMYFGTFLIGLGIVLTLFKIWLFPLFMVIFSLIYIPQVRKEEALLTARFKDEYTAYCLNTPRYVPSVSGWLNMYENIYINVAWIKKEIVSVLCIFIGVYLFEIWGDYLAFQELELWEELLEFACSILAFSILVHYFKEDK